VTIAELRHFVKLFLISDNGICFRINHHSYIERRLIGPAIEPLLPTAQEFSMTRRALIVSTALLLVMGLAACNESGSKPAGNAGAGGAAQQAAPVGVVTLKKDTYPITTILPGRAEAFQVADIRPQVNGIIREIAFKEGGEVKKDDLLYQIDDAAYRAAVEQAQAAISKAQAGVPSAQSNFDRYQRLVGSGATQIEFETARTALAQSNAEVESAKAALSAAQIDLDHTKITAPFDGVIDQTAYNIGNVVAANQSTALTTVRQLDPIYISLTESSTNLLKLRDAIAAGEVKGEDNNIAFRLILEDGREYNQKGKLDMSKQVVSETTGTFIIRVVFPNPDRVVLPGMYVRATVELGAEAGYSLPQLATTRDANGRLTAQFISAEGKVETRVFENATPSNNSWLVTQGVKDGDQLIVSGLQSIVSGMPVKPVPMKINDNGVVVPADQPVAGGEQKPAAK
jgi:membrane fusion protein (multidrug efflux system)